ncbi:hypothetical protein AGMMS49974_06840 [Deltaproteobacteria bacterium]|nr:hypothetical protein AGMMS49974_06840 [Deltaproteobacteria bacterium]
MDNLYNNFAARFRGSRALIIDRLKIYLLFILDLKKFYPSAPALDFCCGAVNDCHY